MKETEEEKKSLFSVISVFSVVNILK